VSAVLRTRDILLRDPTWVSTGYLVHLRLWLDRNDKLAIFFNYMTRRLIDSSPLNYLCSYCHFHYTYLRIFFYFIQHWTTFISCWDNIAISHKIVKGSKFEKFFHIISPLSIDEIVVVKVSKKYHFRCKKALTWIKLYKLINWMIIFYCYWFYRYENV